jgi:hypothetical protein
MLVSVWIVACALLVQGEYGDGYQTIANARYFFGDSPNYYVQRGPLAALALWPVEMFVSWFDWNPLDVRPYHIYSGILHILYLPACWLLLKRTGHAPVAQLLAFLAAVLCVVFYAYAPYLSHDIIPGFLFLALIFLFHRWLNAADNKTALLLVLLGTAVTFIKQTYAIFWIALIVYASVAFILKWNEQRVTGRKILILFALAAVSGVISWLGYGLFIAKELPDVSILMRPLALINAVSTQYDADLSTLFAPDMYLRNAHNYGVAALLLIIPGLIYAFRAGDARLRMSAVCWLVCFVIMQFLSYREVRYLAFLAPLTAVLIAPIMQIVLKRRVLAGIVIAALVVDQSRGIALAAEQISSTTRINVIRFVDAPVGNGKIVSSETLSFVYMADSPLLRDPYHGIYHLTMEHMLNLHEGQLDILKLDDPRNLGLAGIEPGDRVYYSNNTIIRKAPWQENNVPPDLPQLLLVSGDAAAVELVRQDTEFAINSKEGGYVMLIPGPDRGPQMPLIAQASLSMEQTQSVYGDVDGLERLSVTGVIVRALCQADRCSYR